VKGHCSCEATGLSSHAIARAFGHCHQGGTDYPHDPADLLRCIDYCAETGISTKGLAKMMTPVSEQWARLVAEWDSLAESCLEEKPSGRAPITYARMKELIHGVEVRS
jgi:hypothetical protein